MWLSDICQLCDTGITGVTSYGWTTDLKPTGPLITDHCSTV